MQTTSDLWISLCQELQHKRKAAAPAEHHLAARQFCEGVAKVFSPISPRLSAALEIAGDVCQAAGCSDEAVAHFEDALQRNLKSEDFAAAARVTTKLAFLFSRQENRAGARKHFLQAIDLFESAHDRSQHSMILLQLADLEMNAGDFTACEQHYQAALDHSVRLHGEKHPATATICSNFGIAYSAHGDGVNAENFLMRALGIREQIFGAMHPEVAASLANLAVAYHTGKQNEKAAGYYRAALQTYAAFQRPDAPESAAVQANLTKLEARQK